MPDADASADARNADPDARDADPDTGKADILSLWNSKQNCIRRYYGNHPLL